MNTNKTNSQNTTAEIQTQIGQSKAIIGASSLLKALKAIAPTMQRKPLIPLLSGVMIQYAGPGMFSVLATNLEFYCTYLSDCGECTANPILVDYFQLVKLLKTIPGNQAVVIEQKENRVQIKSSGGTFVIRGWDASDFPNEPVMGRATNWAKMGDFDKQQLIKSVAFCSNDELRLALTGIYLGLEIVTTDANVLYRTEFEAIRKITEEQAIKPVILNRGIVKYLQQMSSPVVIETDESRCFIKSDNMYVSSKLIDEKYPDYPKVADLDYNIISRDGKEPNPDRILIQFNKSTIVDALNQCLSIGSNYNKMVVLVLDYEKGEMNLINTILDEESSSISCIRFLPINTPAAGRFSMGFNAQFLLKIFKSMKFESVTMSMMAANKPAFFSNGWIEEWMIMPCIIGDDAHTNVFNW